MLQFVCKCKHNSFENKQEAIKRRNVMLLAPFKNMHTAMCESNNVLFTRNQAFQRKCYCVKSLKNIQDFCFVASKKDVGHDHEITILIMN